MNIEKCMAWAEYKLSRVRTHLTGRESHKTAYNGKTFLSPEETNDLMGKAIDGEEPFMAGRYGGIELYAFWRVKDDGTGIEYDEKKALETLCFNAGFFPKKEELLLKFADEMKKATYQVDLIGVWHYLMEEYELGKWGNDPKYCRARCLEPFWVKNPWTAHLRGKKVLVIHPFTDTIEYQYHSKRETLFENPDILPEYELMTLRAVQTIAGNVDPRFETWFDALDYMEEEALKQDFDVAIIGCGAYGFPLAARLKKAGKKAIHLGGATQLLFGIKGSRWESREDYRSLMNDNWTKPLEKPANADKIENGCYW